MAIPSKLFESLTLPGRVLAFATPSCATARALEGTDAAVVDPGDPAAHARSLGRLYEDFKDGTYLPAPPPPGLSRAAQAALFIGEIERRVPPAISTVALQDVHLERDPSATSR